MKKIKVLLVFIITSTVLIYFTFLVEIKQIDCVSHDSSCHPQIVDSLNQDLPNKIYKIKQNISNYMSQNKNVSNYFVKFRFPNKLTVVVETYQPKFALISNDEGSWYSIIGDNGMVVSIEETTELEYLYVSNLPNPGEHVSEETISSYKIYNNIKFYFNISKAEILDDGLLLQSERGYQALLPHDGDPEILVGSVMVVFDRLNTLTEKSIINNRDDQRLSNLCSEGCLVDFRFHNPVIKDKI